MRQLLIMYLLASALLRTIPAGAGEESRPVAKPSKIIRVEMNKSAVFRLEKPVTRVSVATPEIADVTLITPKQIMIVSKQRIGITNLIVWHGDEHATAYDVEVYIPSHLLTLVKTALEKLAPGAKITPSLTKRCLVLDGFVEDQETLERVLKIAKSYVPEVTNLVRVRGTIQNAIDKAVPNAKLTVTMKNKGIVVDGTVDSQEMLVRALQVARSFTPHITNLVRIKGPQQVQLEVTIAEVSRSAMQQIGLNYLTNSHGGRFGAFNMGSLSDSAGTASRGYSGEVDTDTGSGNQIGTGTGTETGTSISSSSQSLSMAAMARSMWRRDKIADVFSAAEISSPYGTAFQVLIQSMNRDRLAIISLLKGQGLARTLATPTLVTLNGQKAEFLVGGEIPYVTQEQIIFREFGIQLKFTPFVTGTETITLRVEPSVSSPDWSFNPPGLKRRSGSATLQLKDGQTFVMAGLLTEEVSEIKNKIPFLGDLPVLGTLFSSKQFRKNESELVIVVTPRLVRALNPTEVPPLPGADMKVDTADAEFFLLNGKWPFCARNKKTKVKPAHCGRTGFAR